MLQQRGIGLRDLAVSDLDVIDGLGQRKAGAVRNGVQRHDGFGDIAELSGVCMLNNCIDAFRQTGAVGILQHGDQHLRLRCGHLIPLPGEPGDRIIDLIFLGARRGAVHIRGDLLQLVELRIVVVLGHRLPFSLGDPESAEAIDDGDHGKARQRRGHRSGKPEGLYRPHILRADDGGNGILYVLNILAQLQIAVVVALIARIGKVAHAPSGAFPNDLLQLFMVMPRGAGQIPAHVEGVVQEQLPVKLLGFSVLSVDKFRTAGHEIEQVQAFPEGGAEGEDIALNGHLSVLKVPGEREARSSLRLREAFRRRVSDGTVLELGVDGLLRGIVHGGELALDPGTRLGESSRPAKVNEHQLLAVAGDHDVFRLDIQVQDPLMLGLQGLLRDELHNVAEVRHELQDLVLIFQDAVVPVALENVLLLLVGIVLEIHQPVETVFHHLLSAQLPVLFSAEFIQVPAVDEFLDHAEIGFRVDRDVPAAVLAFQRKVAEILDHVVDLDDGAAFPQIPENAPFLFLEDLDAVYAGAVCQHRRFRLELQHAGKLHAAVLPRLHALIDGALRAKGNEAVAVQAVGGIDGILIFVAVERISHASSPSSARPQKAG